MGNTYGYVRVSGIDQNEDRQLRVMQDLSVPTENVYVDKQSGKDFACNLPCLCYKYARLFVKCAGIRESGISSVIF